jgi:hypothetical protein
MKKVLGTMSKFVAAAFSIAILGLLMSLTYGALQRIFPGNFANQMWGVVLFDIAAMAWALTFVFQSKSVGQYASSAIGFLVGFIGTIVMVGAEVMLSGTTLNPEQTLQLQKWMTWTFIGATALHAALVYAHHAMAPDISEQIEIGIARGEIVTEAISQATKSLDEQKASLAYSIRNDIIAQAKRDLGLIEADPRMPLLPKQSTTTAPGLLIPPDEWTRLQEKYPDAPRVDMPVNIPHPTEQPYAYHRGEPMTQAEAQEAVNMGFIDRTGKGGTRPPRQERPLSEKFRSWVNSLKQPAAQAVPQAKPAENLYPMPQHEETQPRNPDASIDPETGKHVSWDPELDRMNREKPASPPA